MALNYTEMQHFADGLGGEFTIEADNVDGASFTLALCAMTPDGSTYAPELRCFDDGLPTLMAFFLAGGAKALAWEGKSASGFAAALRQTGIWSAV